jgi:hypothetical protein
MSEETPKPIQQPPIKRGPSLGRPRYDFGGKRSVAVLRELGFDPIRKLVERYKELENEIAFWKGIRDRSVIQIIDDKGKERYYDSDAHMQAEKMLLDVGDKLLRYGYGRVPETVNVNDTRPPALVVNLTTTGDQQHYINEKALLEHEDDDE